MDDNESQGRKKSANLLKDDRFKALFSNPEFEVDKNADEYKMLTPVLSRLQKGKVKELKRKVETTMPFMDDDEKVKSSDDDLFSEEPEDEEMESSDDDDRTWEKNLKETYRKIRIDQKAKSLEENDNSTDEDENDDEPTTTFAHSGSSNGISKNMEFKVKNITTKANK